jgi:hypothetical protein
VDDVLTDIDEKLSQGNLGGAVGLLRAYAERLPLDRLAAFLERAGVAAGFDDLAQAARAVVAQLDDPAGLYRLGYACVERGVSAIAVPILAAALDRAPGTLPIIGELAIAYEDNYRYQDAVGVLEANESVLRDWPERYLLAFNALMSGDVAKARHWAARLAPPDDTWAHAQQRLAGMLDRTAVLERLDAPPLRLWHYVLNASVLAMLSPYGYDEGMNGRYGFIQDTPELCATTLTRLRAVLPGASSVCLLPDRSSRILGLAAAHLLDLPARPWPSTMDGGELDGAVVVAYDLSEVDPDIVMELHERAPGSVLVEHASCWTKPPVVAADVVGFLHQYVVAPWGQQLLARPGEDARWTDPDGRSEEELAAEIVAAAADASTAVETLPDDTPEHLVAFVGGLGGGWPATGPRDRVWSPGPVPSSQFL